MTAEEFTQEGQYETYKAYTNEGDLLYVGRSISTLKRLEQHAYQSGWYGQVETLKIERHQTFELAARAEKESIKEEDPLWNIQHASNKVLRQRKKHSFKQAFLEEEVADFLRRCLWSDETYKHSYSTVLMFVLCSLRSDYRIPHKIEQIAKTLKISTNSVYRAWKWMTDKKVIVIKEYDGREWYYFNPDYDKQPDAINI